jgi:hypothetical protein
VRAEYWRSYVRVTHMNTHHHVDVVVQYVLLLLPLLLGSLILAVRVYIITCTLRRSDQTPFDVAVRGRFQGVLKEIVLASDAVGAMWRAARRATHAGSPHPHNVVPQEDSPVHRRREDSFSGSISSFSAAVEAQTAAGAAGASRTCWPFICLNSRDCGSGNTRRWWWVPFSRHAWKLRRRGRPQCRFTGAVLAVSYGGVRLTEACPPASQKSAGSSMSKARTVFG